MPDSFLIIRKHKNIFQLNRLIAQKSLRTGYKTKNLSVNHKVLTCLRKRYFCHMSNLYADFFWDNQLLLSKSLSMQQLPKLTTLQKPQPISVKNRYQSFLQRWALGYVVAANIPFQIHQELITKSFKEDNSSKCRSKNT